MLLMSKHLGIPGGVQPWNMPQARTMSWTCWTVVDGLGPLDRTTTPFRQPEVSLPQRPNVNCKRWPEFCALIRTGSAVSTSRATEKCFYLFLFAFLQSRKKRVMNGCINATKNARKTNTASICAANFITRVPTIALWVKAAHDFLWPLSLAKYADSCRLLCRDYPTGCSQLDPWKAQS
jgi:hypothetical protein